MWLENTRQLIPQICTKLSKGQKHQKNVKTDSPKLLGSADFFFSFALYAVESAHDFHEKWMIQYIKYCFTKGNLECGQQHRENRWKSTTNSFKLFQCQTKWTTRRLGPRLKNPVHPVWPPALALTPYPNSRFLLVSSSCLLSSSLTLQKTSSLIHDNIWCVRTGMTGCILGVFMTPQRGYLPRVWGRGMPSRPLFPLILSLNTPLWITSAPPATHPPQHVHRLL